MNRVPTLYSTMSEVISIPYLWENTASG